MLRFGGPMYRMIVWLITILTVNYQLDYNYQPGRLTNKLDDKPSTRTIDYQADKNYQLGWSTTKPDDQSST